MEFPDKVLWQPSEQTIAGSLLGELGRRLGTCSYDELLCLSVQQPEAYWRAVMDHLGFAWREPFRQFCALERGLPFPHWFVRGRCNWVDNVLRWREHPLCAERAAVVAEREDGATESLSYAALTVQVLQCAAGLRRHGLGPGDRIGLMLPMGIPAVVSFLAIAALGAVAVPLFTGFGPDAAADRLALAQARFLIASAGFERRGKRVSLLAALGQLQDRLPGLCVFLDGDADSMSQAPRTAISWTSLLSHPPLLEPKEMDANDPFMIVFTSGTTGKPKGTVHTHAGFPLKILHDCAYHFEIRPGDAWLWPSDMGWIVGPITTIGALSRGATLVCYDGAPDHPSASRLPRIIDRHGVTHFGASPTLVRNLAAAGNEALKGTSFDSLKLLMVAGEVIDPDHFEWLFRTFGRAELPVINYTGGTEASGALLGNVPVRSIKASAFNSPSPGIDAYVADGQGARIFQQVGELTVGAPFVGMTRGFWQDDERYLESYWNAVPGVWTHGDFVFQDRDGHFLVLGRSDDTLKIAGKRVGPAEVEAVVLQLPQISEVAAVGMPDPVKGQSLVICAKAAERAGDHELLETLVADAIQAALGKPFRPSQVHLVAELPKTRNGKVMRRVIRQVLCGESPGDLSSLENPGAIEVLRGLQFSTR